MDNSKAVSSNTSNSAPPKTATIIPFPGHRIVAVHNHTEASLKDNLVEHRINLISTVADDLMNLLYAHLVNSGLNIDETDEKFQRDWCFLYEGFRSVLYRSYGLEHHFHKMVDDTVDIDDEEGRAFFKDSEDESPDPPPTAA